MSERQAGASLERPLRYVLFAFMNDPMRNGARRASAAAFLLAVSLITQHVAQAGHESPFYPSFYPQEIRIETRTPAIAAFGWPSAQLHAYVGDDPFAGGAVPPDATAVQSFRSYLVLTFDAPTGPLAIANSDATTRCAAARRAIRTFAPAGRAAYVPHAYPVTPYHPDYLEQYDLAARARAQIQDASTSDDPFKIRAQGALALTLVPANARADGAAWDATLEEIEIDHLVEPLASLQGGQADAPWIKYGWFQTHLLYGGSSNEGAGRKSAEAAYRRLVTGEYRTRVERINLERALVSTLVSGCERVVVGYTLKREYYNSEYSNGVENVGFDSQAGLRTPLFIRTVKLKDFPWNGWLRLGVRATPAAAWNPVGGLNDAFGRLLWLAVSDAPLLPAPYGGGWLGSRVSVSDAPAPSAAAIPRDAWKPQPGTGLLRRVGAGKTAQLRLRYSVTTSAFHDGTTTGLADVLYPYIFAFRWGVEDRRRAGALDPVVARTSALLRESLAGFKMAGEQTQVRDFGSDLKFTYRVLTIDVYLNRKSMELDEVAAMAPPWSTLPWEVIVLMEEAVQRGAAAFSESEAKRRGIPWLDLVRDRATNDRLATMVEEFRSRSYRPAALRDLVTPGEARERWAALAAFYAKDGHFLVTNGPYRLASWNGEGVVLQVFRDLSYPQGVGSFDDYAIPRRAYVAKVENRGDRLEISADVDQISKFQRSYEIERVAFDPVAQRGDDKHRPECRYVIVADDGNVIRAGALRLGDDNPFTLDLADLTAPGLYRVLLAMYVDGNAVDPEITRVEHRVADPRASRSISRNNVGHSRNQMKGERSRWVSTSSTF